MDGKCKECRYENKCACYDCCRLDRKDMFEPKIVEIRPENAGELWEYSINGYPHFIANIDNKLCLMWKDGTHVKVEDSNNPVIHNKNGWIRLFPPVEDDSIERIETEGISFDLKGYDRRVFIKEWDKIKNIDILGRLPMKMILEIPKGKP